MKIKLMSGALVLALLSPLTYADTSAFGMTLGKTTLDAFMKDYPSAVKEGISEWTDGEIYSIPAGVLNFDGLKGDYVIFTQDGKLTAITINLDKERFNKIHEMLAKKYKVAQKNIPFVGNKLVRYTNGDDVIELNAPHLSFEMNLLYAEKKFMDVYSKRKTKKESKKDSDELNKL
ncbi:hypothetical protein DO628_20860 [Salmonella enterica subsp. salamae]|nr:hypothetical protein [Salmonella enterica subsp. salamae serovar Sofia]EBS4543435.1 hypothetical protein [Salmonella enterica subsp. salamae serovar Sofia]